MFMWVTAALGEVTVGLCGETAAMIETVGIIFLSGTWWKGNYWHTRKSEQIRAWCFTPRKAEGQKGCMIGVCGQYKLTLKPQIIKFVQQKFFMLKVHV